MLALAWLACNPDPNEVPVEPPAQEGPVWADVAPLLDRCAGCHDHSGLTVPITTWEEAAAVAPSLRAAVLGQGRLQMPPFPAGPADVAYRDDPRLTEEEIALVTAWVDAGAQAGPDPRPLVPPPPLRLPRIDLALTWPEPYTPAGAPDDIRCFVLDTRELAGPGSQGAFITGLNVVPGNREAAHHILALRLVPASTTDNPLVAAWTDPGPGFDCGGSVTSSSFPGQYSGLGGWLPGRGAVVLPEGTGLFFPPDALLLVEAHYYTPSGSAAPDASTVELMVAPEVERAAAELRLSDPAWTGGLAVAAGQTATHRTAVAAERLEHLEELTSSSGLLLHAITPHMHQHGVSIRVTLQRGGDELVLVDIPSWSFDWQLQYWLAEPLMLTLGDELTLSCTYANDGTEDVLFGTGTGDEMCVARLLVSEP